MAAQQQRKRIVFTHPSGKTMHVAMIRDDVPAREQVEQARKQIGWAYAGHRRERDVVTSVRVEGQLTREMYAERVRGIATLMLDAMADLVLVADDELDAADAERLMDMEDADEQLGNLRDAFEKIVPFVVDPIDAAMRASQMRAADRRAAVIAEAVRQALGECTTCGASESTCSCDRS